MIGTAEGTLSEAELAVWLRATCGRSTVPRVQMHSDDLGS
jgi:hypothetical protein